MPNRAAAAVSLMLVLVSGLRTLTDKTTTGAPERAHAHAGEAPSSGGDDPLSFFDAPAGNTGSRRFWLHAAAGAGLLAGLAVAGLMMAAPPAETTGEAASASAQEAEMAWQRTVISGKGDFSQSIRKAITAPADAMGSGGQELHLLTSFASPVAASAAWRPSASVAPAILQASLIMPEAETRNETVISKTLPAEPEDRTFTLGRGERLVDKLLALGVSQDAASALLKALEPIYPEKLLRPGQKFSVTLDRQQDFYGAEVLYPVYFAFSPRPGENIILEADDEGRFSVRTEGIATANTGQGAGSAPATGTIRPKARPRSLMAGKADSRKRSFADARYIRARGRVSSSLYAAARDQNIPAYIISQMLKAFSYSVDLQRQVNKGDSFEVLYGPPMSGSSKRRKVLYYAALNLRGRKIAYYRFTTPAGRTGYYDDQGRSAARGLMATPISGARITSGFGMRRHPVLGYTKMHTGIDFGAARGTPIHAAGSGTVVHAGWKGGYGRTVMIRHDNGYVTLYAHQSRIARGIRKGVRVRQGQVIGYVGASGRVTGPHLHFEVRINNKPVNPLRVRTAHRLRLKGKALAAFRQQKGRIMAILRQTPTSARVARR